MNHQLKAHFDDLPWIPMRELPGFDGADYPGMEGKFFGDIDKGPWFYIVRHQPWTRIPRHSHAGSVTHYLLQGEWIVDGEFVTAGHWHHEEPGTFWGPIQSQENGSTTIAIYDRYPTFVPWTPGVDNWDPPEDYSEWAGQSAEDE
jgi:hypothetical protein